MKVYTVLEELLKREPAFVDEKGELNKWLVINKAQNYDNELISLLLDDKTISEIFFKKIKTVFVFNQGLFIQFLEQKKYLNNSYTIYKNKIGLNINNKYLDQRNEVALVWPFKDCILEGGQNTEEEKREEIFFNEILAQDEINQLLDPKVLTNAKKITPKGEGVFDKFERDNNGLISNNLLIKGNNLITLHTLRNQFAGSIKLIYIDPPYNTAGDNNTFTYNNTFNHSTWLTFMKNRLDVAKELLDSDGVIAIAIDDEEYAHLKVLCDEIFKRPNYIGTIVVQSNPRGRTTNTHFATSHEYTLFYAKNIAEVAINFQKLTKEQELDFGDSDDAGTFRYLPFRRSGGTSTPKERQNSEFTIFYSKSKKNIIAVGGKRLYDYPEEYAPETILTLNENNEIEYNDVNVFLSSNEEDIVEINPIDTDGKRRVWRWADRLEILKAAKAGDFNIVTERNKNTIQLKDRSKGGRKPKTIWYDSKYDASSNGTMLLKKLFEGEKVFSYPKSIYAVKDVIEIITDKNNNDIVLDFFGGSGTTAHAVLELNKEDGGNRRFIICEQMDYVETVTKERVKKVLQDGSDNEFIYFELKKYNQAFIDDIQAAKSTEILLNIWEQMKKVSFINYNVDLKKQDDHIESFKALKLVQQKQHLVDLLNKNQLYVNLSSLNDKDFGITEEEKKVTRDFYEMKK